MKALLVVVTTLGLGLALAEPGRACSRPASLYPVEPRAVVADADAAFIGTLVGVRAKEPPAMSSGAPHVFTFAIDERVKGDLGATIEVTSTLGGSMCGLEATIGRRSAYLLDRIEGPWGPWGVAEVSVETLRQGVLPLPEPDGSGRAMFVAGGHFGLARSATLDSRGRVLSYGWGGGAVTALSVCPGGRILVELLRARERVRLAWRELPTLKLLREAELNEGGYGEDVVCRSRSGSEALASVVALQRAETQLVQVTPIGTRIIERGPRLAFVARGAQAFVSVSDGRIVVRDLAAGTRRVLLRSAGLLTGLSISHDRRFLAGFTDDALFVVDLVRRETRGRPWGGFRSRTEWTDRRTFVAWSPGADGRLELFDQRLRRLRAAWSWPALATTVRRGGVFGVDPTGAFLTGSNGFILRLGQVFSPALVALEPL